MESITERDAATAYARAWNLLDPTVFLELLAPDAHYASQWVFDELQDNGAIADYLTSKMKAVKNGNDQVFAVLGKTTASFPDRNCVVMAQGNKDSVKGTVLFTVERRHIKRFVLCIPELLQAMFRQYCMAETLAMVRLVRFLAGKWT